MPSSDFEDKFWQKKYLLCDSRMLVSAKDTIFFALQGRYQDGHAFIGGLYAKGVRNFVVSKMPEPTARWASANFVCVAQPLRCMQDLAAYRRRKFGLQVVGITGSNGKTIVKEWLYTLLSPNFRIVKSPKSYNSQLGVPLSVWEIDAYHNLGIFEAGISQKGEMARLQHIILPDIGILTNIGPAHDEGFSSRAEKLAEKMTLFSQVKVLIFNADEPLISAAVRSLRIPQKWSWGRTKAAKWQLTKQKPEGEKTKIELKHHLSGELLQIDLPFTHAAAIENALHSIVLMLFLGKKQPLIQQRIENLRHLPMRLELKEGQFESQIIDDTYSNDALSLRIALDFLAQHRQEKNATIILSDLQQTGRPSEKVYAEIAKWFAERKIDKLLAVGKQLSRFHSLFSTPEKHFFPNTASLIAFLEKKTPFFNEIILIKGARSFGFERLVDLLQKKRHGTRLEIDLEALAFNLKFFRGFLNPNTKIMAMVKAFAYGSGSHQIAKQLEYQGVDYLAVAYTDEGANLRKKGVGLPIMVMNPLPESYPLLLKYALEPEIYSLPHLQSLLRFFARETKKKHKKIKIHLKIESGMNRLGFVEADFPALIDLLTQHPELEVSTLFSHLAAADLPGEKQFTAKQVAHFKKCTAYLEHHLPTPPLKHILNSAGITQYPDYQMDMVRIGLGLYGINAFYPDALQTVSTLKTNISQIKTLHTGDTVGYGRCGKIKKTSKIATIPIGYADGFDRRFSNGVGKVWINGSFAPVIGNVCMDMSMIDVSKIDTKPGDEVIIFGKENPVGVLAKSIDTIPYEILTNIKNRVHRIFFVS